MPYPFPPFLQSGPSIYAEGLSTVRRSEESSNVLAVRGSREPLPPGIEEDHQLMESGESAPRCNFKTNVGSSPMKIQKESENLEISESNRLSPEPSHAEETFEFVAKSTKHCTWHLLEESHMYPSETGDGQHQSVQSMKCARRSVITTEVELSPVKRKKDRNIDVVAECRESTSAADEVSFNKCTRKSVTTTDIELFPLRKERDCNIDIVTEFRESTSAADEVSFNKCARKSVITQEIELSPVKKKK